MESAISQGQFWIVRDEKGKTQLIRLAKLGPKVIGVVQKLPHISRETIEVDSSDLMILLGKNPPVGSILGHKTHFLYRNKQISLGRLGEAYLMYRPEDLDTISGYAEEAGNTVYKGLKEVGLKDLADGVVLEVTDKVGKYAGMYFTKKTDIPPRIRFTLEDSASESASLADKEYLIYHELGHHLDFEFVSDSDKAKAAWMQAFNRSISPINVEEDELSKYHEDLNRAVEGGSIVSIREHLGSLSEDDVPRFKTVLKWIARNKRLSVLDINVYIRSGDTAALAEVWPEKAVTMERISPEVSEYSCKNMREFFAESFAFYMCGRTLPKYITKLVENSIKLAGKKLAA